MDLFKVVMIVISLVHNAKQLGIIPIEPKCSDSVSSENSRCCTSYRTIGGKCYPCIGSFGLECSKLCPKGYYGLKCQDKCECDRCNATTGNCFHEENSSRMSVACLAFFATGCVFFVAALITCLCVKRQFSGKRYDKYVQDSRSLGESASQIYTRMEENVYQECEQTSTIYNDSTNSSCLSQYDRSHLLERIKENKAKPSILSLLRWKKRCSGKTLAKSGYIYVIGSQEHLTESASGSGEAPLRLRVIPEPPTQPMLPLPLSSSHIATATVPT